jgi:hypothetical protein
MEALWRQIAKDILGMPTRAPTNAVFGELGWLPLWVRLGWQAIKYWTRAIEMEDGCLVKEALYKQVELNDNEHECWLTCIQRTLYLTKTGRLFWNEWLQSIKEKRNIKCVRYDVIIDDTSGKVKINSSRWEDIIYKELQDVAIGQWSKEVNTKESRNGVAGNKLRTYCKFKTEWGREFYL